MYSAGASLMAKNIANGSIKKKYGTKSCRGGILNPKARTAKSGANPIVYPNKPFSMNIATLRSEFIAVRPQYGELVVTFYKGIPPFLVRWYRNLFEEVYSTSAKNNTAAHHRNPGSPTGSAG